MLIWFFAANPLLGLICISYPSGREKNNPVGIISTVDINNRVVAEEKNSSTLKARDIMTKPIETVEVSSTCEEAYQKMVSKGTYSIPVTENGSLIGSLSFSKLFGKVC